MKRIYIANNYFYIEDDTTNVIEFRYPTSRVYLFSNTGSLYIFKKIGKNEIIEEAIKYSDIKDSAGNAYTNEAEFLDLIDKNTASPDLSNSGTLDVLIQDNNSPDISLYLAQLLDTATVLSNIALNDETIDIETTGVAPVAGNFIFLREGTSFSQTEIMTVTPISGNQYTLGITIPSDFPYTTASTCDLQNVDMDVNGSTTPIEFELVAKDNSLFAFDITRMIISMVLQTAGDDGLFGNITALTDDGMYFRIENGITKNMFNVKNNSDFSQEGFDVSYTTRSGGGGSYGLSSRITFNGSDKRGIVKRLKFDTEDRFVSVVRANQTGLNKFRIKLQGHVSIE